MKLQQLILFLSLATCGTLFPSIAIDDVIKAIDSEDIDQITELYNNGTLKYLVDEKPNVLHTAIDRGSAQIVEILLKAGFDPNTQEELDGGINSSALYLAAQSHTNEIINLLVRYGAQVTEAIINQAPPRASGLLRMIRRQQRPTRSQFQ